MPAENRVCCGGAGGFGIFWSAAFYCRLRFWGRDFGVGFEVDLIFWWEAGMPIFMDLISSHFRLLLFGAKSNQKHVSKAARRENQMVILTSGSQRRLCLSRITHLEPSKCGTSQVAICSQKSSTILWSPCSIAFDTIDVHSKHQNSAII